MDLKTTSVTTPPCWVKHPVSVFGTTEVLGTTESIGKNHGLLLPTLFLFDLGKVLNLFGTV